jgi:hypothetical protein
MTNQQRTNALAIAAALPYTGFDTLIVEAGGRWVSPASSAHRPDCLAFRWQYDDEAGERQYSLVSRAGDEIKQPDGSTWLLVLDESSNKLKWQTD